MFSAQRSMLIPLACQLGRQKASINSLVVALQNRVGRQVTLANQRRSRRRLFTSSDHHQLVVRRIRGAFVDPIMQRPVGQAHCPNWAAEIHCYGVWSGIVSNPVPLVFNSAGCESTPELSAHLRVITPCLIGVLRRPPIHDLAYVMWRVQDL